ncbi:MAG: DUF3089 domain-containing protein [Allosphingosinicella sp.]
MARKKSPPAVRFLWIVAGLTVLFVLLAGAYRLFEQDLMRWAMVPKAEFVEVPMPDGATYAQARLWIARPDIPNNPALWTPQGFAPTRDPRASVFFIHPTSFLDTSAWNAGLEDEESQQRARLFVRSQASAFNSVGAIWAPKYRQATFGAFLTTRDTARRALDFAYRDVRAAYEQFLREAPADKPIILAAHSQGSLHLLRLLEERVRGAPEAERIAAAYVVGWPVSETADLPALPLAACDRPDQAHCLLSWQSFAEPADPKQVTDVYDASRGLNGVPRAGSPMVCVNPLTGTRGAAAPASANLGALVPNGDLSEASFRPQAVPAHCDLRGFLLIGDNDNVPDFGPYVLPGHNYHVYDYALFWANVRADAERRLTAFLGDEAPGPAAQN